MLGWSDTRVSRGMDRAAPEIAMLLNAWEIMTLAQRAAWLDALGVTIERRRPGRPRKR